MKITESLIKEKINEYILLLKEKRYIRLGEKELEQNIRNSLNSLKIKFIEHPTGDANVFKNELRICSKNIEKRMLKKGDYYLDEVLFHEFSHIINSFHKSIFGSNNYYISNYLNDKIDDQKFIDDLAKNELLHNQDPYLGITLLDEFVAQMIAQDIILHKIAKMDKNFRKKYIFDEKVTLYKARTFLTNISQPPMYLQTSFAVYEEFYAFALDFIKKYNLTTINFVKDSLKKDVFKKIVNDIKDNKEALKELYIHLCYLGIIKESVYLSCGYKEITDKKDPANDKRKVYTVMKKLKNR